MMNFLIFPSGMEYDIPRKLSPEKTGLILLWEKNKKRFNRQVAWNF